MEPHMPYERLLGRLEEFKEWTKAEFCEINEKLYRISSDIESINKSRFIFQGKIIVGSSLCVMLIETAIRKLIR